MLVLRMGIQFYAVLQPSDLWPAIQNYDDGNAGADDDFLLMDAAKMLNSDMF